MRCRVPLFLLLIFGSTTAGAQQLRLPPHDTLRFSKRLALPADYYATHLGFFCKKEMQLQKWARLPVFFRLGSKDYVDYLEQKPNTRKRL
jgi:hypothetical protein